MKDHVHDCTTPDATCPCGYVFRVPRFSCSIEVFDGRVELVNTAFNSDWLNAAIRALREAADKLESIR